jgi:hypothetical protein
MDLNLTICNSFLPVEKNITLYVILRNKNSGVKFVDSTFKYFLLKNYLKKNIFPSLPYNLLNLSLSETTTN